AWQRHCGFLDLSLDEFMQIQCRLLGEQFAIAQRSRLWQSLFGDKIDDLEVATFRQKIPLTSYGDYEHLLRDQPDDVLARPIVAWARTSGRGGRPKWVPYIRETYLHLGTCALASDLLSTAQQRGDIHIRPNDVLVYNTPPPPYLSGLALMALTELFDFHFVPPQEENEQLSFQERNARIFQQAMIEGMDLLGSMTIVLVKMGEQFEQGATQRREFSWQMLHPRLVGRYMRARLKARRAGRDHILPRDLWQPKGIMCGGADTALYREQIKAYWGVYPHEIYGCTEAGILATQAWDHQDMTFIPSTAFYEFIPESAWATERLEGVAPTETVLMDELEVGQRYDVVISNFYGGPFLRYRLHDLIEIIALKNDVLGIRLPQFRFVGRSGDFIDLSGFAGLIDERQVMAALVATQIDFADWVLCKEIQEHEPRLHLYIEVGQALAPAQIRERFHRQLKALNPDYANIETMLGFVPVRVTVLPPGSFNRYIKHQVDQGADLAHLKPARIQPSSEAVRLLLSFGDD
ncbi:MAG: GH3 family domain-containing protein, partial [Ardenticatenaceae bacterium]